MNIQHSIEPWIQTFSGGRFHYDKPVAAEVDIRDIAHALSNLCRYAGHCEHFYSVAQHSYYVSFVVPRDLALQALLHDATEAYCVDIPRPLKMMLPDYGVIEHRIWGAVAEKFGLPDVISPEVHSADNAVLMAEKEQILKPGPAWNITGEPADIEIEEWDPFHAEQMFLDRFEELTDYTAYSRFIDRVLNTPVR